MLIFLYERRWKIFCYQGSDEVGVGRWLCNFLVDNNRNIMFGFYKIVVLLFNFICADNVSGTVSILHLFFESRRG